MPMWTSSQEPTTTHVLLLMRTTTAQLASALLVVQLANLVNAMMSDLLIAAVGAIGWTNN